MARHLAISALTCVFACTVAATNAADLEGVEVTRDEGQGITWYKPKIDEWKTFDFRIYPSIARAEDGSRKMVVVILVKDPPKGLPSTLQVDADEEAWLVPISDPEKIKTHDSGCRVTQTIFVQSQESLVQKLAEATDASIALVGYRHTLHHKMTSDDLANFRRIAKLWNAPSLPPKPSTSTSEDLPAGTVAAGMSRVTNPEIIPSSKKPPRFPRFAEGKRALGRVVLQAVVKKDGTIGDIEVKQGAGGDCGFEESAIEAVRLWRYKPGTLDGEPVDVYFTVVVDFIYRGYRMPLGPP